jgi:acetylglutamate kinase
MSEPVQTDREQRRLIRMAETISKALPYMRRHNDATFVVKYGGHAMTDPKLGDLVARDIVLMKQVGMNPIVVHGGGPQINKMLERVGIKSEFVNGLRVTDQATMDIVEMVLAGAINKAIVADINECGGIAVGICGKDGNLILARKVTEMRDPRSTSWCWSSCAAPTSSRWWRRSASASTTSSPTISMPTRRPAPSPARCVPNGCCS